MRQGPVVLNHPDGLLGALNKLYFQDFPESVRPRTVITRDPVDIKSFAYIVAHEYLPEAEKGDSRMFLMNGVPLMNDGKYRRTTESAVISML